MAEEPNVAVAVSRVLSYSVIFVCGIMKLPQIYALLLSQTAKGINLRSCWLEIGTFLIGFFYGYANNFHYTTYAEAGFLILQASVVIFLVIKYTRKWTLENLICTLLCIAFASLSLAGLIPLLVFRILLSTNLAMSVISTSGQILSLYHLKAQGDVSAITWSLGAYGCLARIFTTSVEVGDLQMLMNYIVGFALCLTVVIQCFYYHNKENKR